MTKEKLTLADGKERVLYFRNTALKIIKEKLGVSVLRNGAAKLFEAVDEEMLSLLLALGFDHEFEGGQPGIIAADVDKILDIGNAPAACVAILKALTLTPVTPVVPPVAAEAPVKLMPGPTTVM